MTDSSARYITMVCFSIWLALPGHASEEFKYVQVGPFKYRSQNTNFEDVIHIDLVNTSNPTTFIEFGIKKYPNVRSVILGGKHFDVKSVEAAHKFPNLQLIVLDSVDFAKVGEIRKQWAQVPIWESERIAIKKLQKSESIVTVERRKLPAGFPEIDDVHADYVVELGRRYTMPVFSPPLDKVAKHQLQYLRHVRKIDLNGANVNERTLKELRHWKDLKIVRIDALQENELAPLKDGNMEIQIIVDSGMPAMPVPDSLPK